MYAENSDVICVNETWLNQNISNSEILHSDFTIFRRDQFDRGGGGVLIAIKTASFKAVKEFKPESEAELQQLEINFTEIPTLTGQIILFCFCYRSPNEDPSWMDVFDIFLHEVCDQFDNMVISGDFNLPDILWDSIAIFLPDTQNYIYRRRISVDYRRRILSAPLPYLGSVALYVIINPHILRKQALHTFVEVSAWWRKKKPRSQGLKKPWEQC